MGHEVWGIPSQLATMPPCHTATQPPGTYLVAATWDAYTIKVHNIKFHSISGLCAAVAVGSRSQRRSRRQRRCCYWNRRSHFAFCSTFYGVPLCGHCQSHCCCCQLLVLLLVLPRHIYLLASHGYGHTFLTHTYTHTHTGTHTESQTYIHIYRQKTFCSAQICSDRKAKNFAQFT